MSTDKVSLDTLKQQLHGSSIYQNFDRWYRSLPSRDQMIVVTLAWAVGFFLAYLMIWKPIQENLASSESSFNASKRELAFVYENEAAARKLSRNNSKSSGGGSILTAVNSSSRQYGLSLKKFEKEGDNGLRIWLENADFNKAMTWFGNLQQRNKISLSQISVDKQNASGLVNIRAVLKR